jgi:hypothetical protein
MRRALTVLLVLSLPGCATCERHPVACAAALTVVATSVALSVPHPHPHDTPPAMTQIPNSPCAANPQACQ